MFFDRLLRTDRYFTFCLIIMDFILIFAIQFLIPVDFERNK